MKEFYCMIRYNYRTKLMTFRVINRRDCVERQKQFWAVISKLSKLSKLLKPQKKKRLTAYLLLRVQRVESEIFEKSDLFKFLSPKLTARPIRATLVTICACIAFFLSLNSDRRPLCIVLLKINKIIGFAAVFPILVILRANEPCKIKVSFF